MQVETNPQEVEQTHSEACIYLLCISPAWPSSPAPWDLIDEYQSIYFMWAVKANYPANVKIFIPTGVTFQGFFFNTWFMLPLLLRETEKSTTRGCTAIASASKRKRR